MIKEAPLNSPGYILNYVSPDDQKTTALDFTKAVRGFTRYEWQEQFVDRAMQEISKADADVEKCLKLAIEAFDHSLADDIRPYDREDGRWTDGAAVYFRSDAFKIGLPPSLKKRLSAETGVDIKEILFFYLEQETGPLLDGYKLRCMTPDILFWTSSEPKSATRPDPICTATRQDVFLSLIKCGVNPLSEFADQSDGAGSEVVQSASEPRSKRIARRKGFLFVKADEESISRWSAKTCACWGRILSCEKMVGFEHGIMLTGSGTAANEISILTARDLTEPGVVYKHPFWYYENEASVARFFPGISEDEKNATVLLINLEPTNHFTLADPNSEANPLETIGNFLQKVAASPTKRFVLVVDATVNPNIDIVDIYGRELPKNLVLLKTVSATKHQKGGRDNFFGVVSFSAAKEIFHPVEDRLTNYSRSTSGPLPGRNAANFPRPTPSWLIEKRAKTANLNQFLAQARSFPDPDRWSISPYSFHSFAFPPFALVKRLAESCAGLGADEVKQMIGGVNDNIFQAISRAVRQSGTFGIEIGDSFGLPITRINTQGGNSLVNGETFRLKIPRVCPGYNSTRGEMQLLASLLLEELDDCCSEVIKMTG